MQKGLIFPNKNSIIYKIDLNYTHSDVKQPFDFSERCNGFNEQQKICTAADSIARTHGFSRNGSAF